MGARILVVDDDPSIRQLIVYALIDEGFVVDEAEDGEDALQLIEQNHPDLILLDMKMPHMDGWAFSRLYRELYGQKAPIIVVTAAHDAAQRGASVSAESIIAKPFDLHLL